MNYYFDASYLVDAILFRFAGFPLYLAECRTLGYSGPYKVFCANDLECQLVRILTPPGLPVATITPEDPKTENNAGRIRSTY